MGTSRPSDFISVWNSEKVRQFLDPSSCASKTLRSLPSCCDDADDDVDGEEDEVAEAEAEAEAEPAGGGWLWLVFAAAPFTTEQNSAKVM
jgi:hypothetical protein